MRKDGFPFVGILFTGLMMTKNGPKVLEYNVRGGDPETQTLLPLLSKDTDLAQIMVACADHWLDGVSLKIDPNFSTTVIAVAGGYPNAYAELPSEIEYSECIRRCTKRGSCGAPCQMRTPT